jgi:uncharacterized repeat protein (TIGR03803 family)
VNRTATRYVRRLGAGLAAALLVLAAARADAENYNLTTLGSFNSTDGLDPAAKLVMDSSGNLYGTTYTGVFKVAPGGGITSLTTFTAATGAGSVASLTLSGGNLYGTNESGGANSDGTLFEVNPTTGNLTTLYSFSSASGTNPVANVIVDSHGNLEGTTNQGGVPNGDGTAYSYNPSTGNLTTLANFSALAGGNNPDSGLISDSHGNLFGAVQHGGGGNNGGIFEIAAGTGTLSYAVQFNGLNASVPNGSLIMDAQGNFWGTSPTDGHLGNNGSIFEWNVATNQAIQVFAFNGLGDGNAPKDGLTIDSHGNFYGTTRDGGANNDGTVFQFNPNTGVLTTLLTFNGTNGAYPIGGVILDSQGDLFGTTTAGGASSRGTVFELTLVPEPSTLLLAATGLAVLPMLHRRRRKRGS